MGFIAGVSTLLPQFTKGDFAGQISIAVWTKSAGKPKYKGSEDHATAISLQTVVDFFETAWITRPTFLPSLAWSKK